MTRVQFRSSKRIPVNLGTGTDESIILGGGFRECWISTRMQALVEVLREKYAANYQYSFQVPMRADVQLPHAAAFSKLIGITAT